MFLGGGLGSVARFALALLVARFAGIAFPWGTLLINVLGSFVIGWFGTRPGAAPLTRLFVMTGLCGGFTTFSAFSLQTIELIQFGAPLRAAAYVGASVLICLAATTAGMLIAR